MIDATHIPGTELAVASAPLQAPLQEVRSALAAARVQLIGFARIALVASILPVTVFIGWLAATEPAIMIGAGLALALWIGCDHEQGRERSAQAGPRMPSLRGPVERPTRSDLSATASWS